MIHNFKTIALICAAIALVPATAGAQQSGTPKGSTSSSGAAPTASDLQGGVGLKKTNTNDDKSPSVKSQIESEKRQRR
jgi:hypothetical protein